ncbi:MAG: HemK/PrmC family methyltransferase, partial [Mariniphaga sp.]
GSGCIPIAFAKNIPGASAEGWDISSDALAIANENAAINNVVIIFHHADILKSVLPENKNKFDIIVSNPPYVTIAEKQLMQKNVLNYEPHTALFVPDNDALVFYRAIADLAVNRLKPGGHLYFEINERYGNETTELLVSKGFINIILKKDINGKSRMIKAEIP